MEFKDYYATLGVPKTASDKDIRKSFRKLARQYHPDVAKDKKGAEEKFKEINEAYEVLGDPEKRRKYDELGANWNQGAQFRRPPGRNQRARRSGGSAEQFGDFEFHFGGTGFSDFFEQFFGSMGGSQRRTGSHDGFREFAHRGQDIEADIMVTMEEALHGATRPVSLKRHILCQRCQGDGDDAGRPCPACAGTGTASHLDKYQVKIPAGVRQGQRLRL